jgi:hypothetical protein
MFNITAIFQRLGQAARMAIIVSPTAAPIGNGNPNNGLGD